MAASSPLASPAHSPSVPSSPAFRRAFSLPVQPRAPATLDSQIEVLFNLPSARIISFTTGNAGSRPSSSSGSPVVDEEPGTLEWNSKLERQLAIGPLRIYRAPGSVAFLNCSNALKPILPKSQCWEVDASGKFVLQIRRPNYWRIEVPSETQKEKLQLEELKDVLDKVLLFEKTPCPFKRDFTVELPEAPTTPAKKRIWTPVERPKLETSPLSRSSQMDDAVLVRRFSHTPSIAETKPVLATLPLSIPKKSPAVIAIQTDHDSIQNTEPFAPILLPSSLPQEDKSIPSYSESDEDADDYSDATDDTNATPRCQLQPAFQAMTLEPERKVRPQVLDSFGRSITAPPLLSLITSPPSKKRTESPLRKSTTIASSDSGFSSTESFHSVMSWHSPLAPPSPPASGESSPTFKTAYPYPHENIVLPKRMTQTKDISELTASPETPLAWEMSPIPDIDYEADSSAPRTPTLMNDSSDKSDADISEIATPPPNQRIRHRATTSSNSHRRQLSPLPAAINLFSPKRRPRRLQTARHIPTAILQKTCEILLSPPSHLFNIMLNIATKIAAGEWRGVLSGYGGEGVHWDFEDEYASEAWTEDDFGISLPSTKKKPAATTNIPGGSWEID